MNKLLTILAISLLVVCFVLGLAIGSKNRLPQGSVVVTQAFLDSLSKIALMPPDTIRDTVYLKGDPVEVEKPVPVPVIITDTTKTYIDSLVNKEIDARVKLTVRGDLLALSWNYRPTIVTLYETIKIPAPYPVPYDKIVKVPQKGLYLELGIGRGFAIEKPAFSGEVFWMTKKGVTVGAEAGYFMEPYYAIKFGKKF